MGMSNDELIGPKVFAEGKIPPGKVFAEGEATSPSLASWIDAARPRTLPLAVSSILTGSLMAVADGRYHLLTIVLALATGVLLQVLSNIANDYGDAVKGTDNGRRTGPPRMVQSGRIAASRMKKGIIVCSILALISGTALLSVAIGDRRPVGVVFVVLGLAAVAAAVRYTIGAKAYGYKGLGDLFVFLFFGLAGVSGTWFLNTLRWQWNVLLPSAAIGLLITGVLNLNNMRDLDNDRASGKRTLAVLLGYTGARLYHLMLILAAFLLAAWFAAEQPRRTVGSFLFLLALPLFARDLVAIFRTQEREKLDPFLGRLALSCLLFTVLFGVGPLL